MTDEGKNPGQDAPEPAAGNGGSTPSPAPLRQDVLEALVAAIQNLNRNESEQTASLERLGERIEQQAEEEARERRFWMSWIPRFVAGREALWRAWLMGAAVRVVAFLIAVGGVWGFLGWYVDHLNMTGMADTYCRTAVRIFQEDENADVALSLLEQAVALNGNDFEIQFQQALIGGLASVRDLFNLDRPYNKEELDRAHQALAQAHILQMTKPNRAEPHVLSAQIRTALKQYDRAQADMERAISLAPEDAFVRLRHGVLIMERLLGSGLYKKGSPEHAAQADAAERELDHALELCRTETGEPGPVLRAARRVLRPFMSLGATGGHQGMEKMVLLWKGVLAAEHRGDFAKARAYYTEALEKSPGFSLALTSRGMAWLHDKAMNLGEARTDFLNTLATDPNFTEAYYGLGMVYGYQNRYDTARYYLDKGLSIDGDSLRLWKLHGLVSAEMKDYETALEDYNKAFQLDPVNPDLYLRKARVLQELGKNDEAISSLNFAAELLPESPRVRYVYGIVYQGAGDMERAMREFEKALEKAPGYDDCLKAKAEILESQNRMDEALLSLQSAVEKCRQQPERFLLPLGRLKWKMGRLEDALADISRARQCYPYDAGAWFDEALLLRELGRNGEALAAAEKALDLKPDHAGARLLCSELKGAQ